MGTTASDGARRWVKAPVCDHSGSCVEVAQLGGGVGVRDSKNPDDHWLWFTCDEWTAFVAGVRSGHFDFVG